MNMCIPNIRGRGRFKLMIGLLSVVVGVAGCGGEAEERGAVIDEDPIVKKDPEAESPLTYFARDRHTEDASVNAFILKALKACEEGSYDDFRQLFGITYTPPSLQEFERVWHNVAEIHVERVFEVPKEAPSEKEYYVYGVVLLRRPDPQNRLERLFVLRIYREAEGWYMGQAEGEVGQKIRRAMESEGESESEAETSTGGT